MKKFAIIILLLLTAQSQSQGHRDLMLQGQNAALHNDYMTAADIYCRAARTPTGRNVVHSILNHLDQYFAAADSAAFVNSLTAFRECVLAPVEVVTDTTPAPPDTHFVRDWLAGTFGRRGFFELEISTLVDLHLEDAPSGRRLAEAARQHLSRRRYRLAAAAATAAHSRLDEENRQNDVAMIAHTAFIGTGQRDSALVWMRRTNAETREARVITATLYQEAGLLDEADSIIATMTPSLQRESLTMRRHFFASDPLAVFNALVNVRSAVWTMNANDRFLFLARSLIFGGRAEDAGQYLDSINFNAGRADASEVLRYRFWLQKFAGEVNILNAWGRLEYMIYVGDLTSAAQIFIGYNVKGEAGEMMAVRVASELARRERFEDALEVLWAVAPISADADAAGDVGPEYLFFVADMLNRTGRTVEARVFAERILRDFPLDINAQRARLIVR